MLIAIQRPHATLVAGFHAWKELGRFVKLGEHGIRILAPVLVKVKSDDPDKEEQRIVRFKPVAVFDISQTDGTPLPEIHHPLKGEAPIGVLVRVKAFIEGRGYTVRYDRTPEGTFGYVNSEKQIVLREGESMAQTLDTLCHEVSHALLGHVGDTSSELWLSGRLGSQQGPRCKAGTRRASCLRGREGDPGRCGTDRCSRRPGLSSTGSRGLSSTGSRGGRSPADRPLESGYESGRRYHRR